MDYEIIDADFRQFYNLEFETVFHKNFPRFCRLLLLLPTESRFIQKYSPTKDWNWEKEVQSRILYKLDTLSCQLSNMFKEKGKAARRPDEQFQPAYVKEAKAKAEAQRKEEELSREDMGDLKQFWEAYNSGVKQL